MSEIGEVYEKTTCDVCDRETICLIHYARAATGVMHPVMAMCGGCSGEGEDFRREKLLSNLLAEGVAKSPPRCAYCHKTPEELDEYVDMASSYEMTPDAYTEQYEGTFNPVSRQFACTPCYFKIGQPTSPSGWKAP